MNSAQLVARKIRDLKITDKTFLTSQALISYLRSMLHIPCRDIGKPVPPCRMIYQTGENSAIAYTDGKQIVLNAGHSFVRKSKSRVSKVRILTGLMLHEYGHYRFTDMDGRGAALAALQGGSFYPALKEDALTEWQMDFAAEFKLYVHEHPNNVERLQEVWHNLDNILEDAFIEECLYRTISGQLIDGLDFVRRKMLNSTPALDTMLKRLEEDSDLLLPVIKSLLLTYAKYGTMKCNYRNEEERNSEPVQWVKQCRPYVDAVIREASTRKRIEAVNMVFLTIWPVIRDFVTKVAESDKDIEDMLKAFSGDMDPTKYDGAAGSASVPISSDEDTGESGSLSKRKATERWLGKSASARKSSRDDSADDDAACSDEGKSMSSTEPDERTKIDGADDSDDIACGELEVHDGDGEIEDLEIEDSYDEEALAADLMQVEKAVREAEAIVEVEAELERELLHEATAMDYGAAHRGLHVTMTRIRKISEDKRGLDDKIAAIDEVAETMVRKVLPAIKRDKGDDMLLMAGFFSGSRFDATRLVMNDCRYFRQSTTPMPDTRLAVSVLVDESGSMRSQGRIAAARAAALSLYLFCEKAGIKCSVLGHTSKFDVGDLRLAAYADYESPDRDDKYRILSIDAKEDNRDGAAILFAGEHLLKREEPTKLMVIISDGAPVATGYSGAAAEHDMSNIVAELRRKGVVVFAAAIGSDKDSIHRIYGDGFIDITNLAALPDQLLQLVRRYIRT